MTIRKIMVPLFGQYGAARDEISLASIETGLSFGSALQCHVETCCLAAKFPSPGTRIPAIVPGSAIEPLIEEIDRRNQESFWHARALFDKVVETFCPAHADEPSSEPNFSASFTEVSGDVSALCAQKGKLADLIVLAGDEDSFSGEYQHNLNVLLTETGRPLCIVPLTQKKISYQRVAIAWNGTAEATRAIALLMGLLEISQSVTLLMVEEERTKDVDPATFADYLAWHGLKADILQIKQKDRGIGQALQEEALNAENDLLVMGAYTRSRLKSLVFGDATGSIIRAPQLPVIMVD